MWTGKNCLQMFATVHMTLKTQGLETSNTHGALCEQPHLPSLEAMEDNNKSRVQKGQKRVVLLSAFHCQSPKIDWLVGGAAAKKRLGVFGGEKIVIKPKKRSKSPFINILLIYLTKIEIF